MSNTTDLVLDEVSLKALAARRALSRRRFLQTATALSAAAAGATLLSGCSSDVSASGPAQSDVLNFALNLEYLEATFYINITTGGDLSSANTTGSGTITNLPGKLTSYNQQTTDILNEIAFDEQSHVTDLRAALGTLAVPRPALNLGALGTILASNALSVARLFEDVGVTAYAGAAQYLSGANLTYAAQILGVEGFHAGALRLLCIQQGQTGYIATAAKPADGYDVLPYDPGVAAISATGPTASSTTVIPAPSTGGGFFATAGGTTALQLNGTFAGFAYTRTTSQVLSIVYGTTVAGSTSGGFFPNGMNGNIKTI
jgi:hypothetical protein